MITNGAETLHFYTMYAVLSIHTEEQHIIMGLRTNGILGNVVREAGGR